MIRLSDGMLLYHGSYAPVENISLSKCRSGLDFGKGFYVTSSFQQARAFIPSVVKRNIRRNILHSNFKIADGYISVYQFHLTKEVLIHIFQTADSEWLHFVASNRDNNLFPELCMLYSDIDIIGGKIANESTAATLNSYVSGEYGVTGSIRADSFTIEGLLPGRLKDQFCFRTEQSLKSLKFIRSERYGN